MAGAVLGSADSAAATPPAPTPQVWTLNSDVAADPVNNPIADSYGNADVWSYLGGAGGDPALFHPLSQYAGNGCGTPGLDSHTAPNTDVPIEVFNGSTTDFPCGAIHEPVGKIAVHPSPSEDSIIAWTAPFSGAVDISGDITDDDAGGGDGVSYALLARGTYLFSDAIPNGGSATFPDQNDVFVQQGDTIYLQVGANGNYLYDSTGLDLTITQHIVSVGRSRPRSVQQGNRYLVVISGTGFTSQTSAVLDQMDGVEIVRQPKITPTRMRIPIRVLGDAPLGVRQWLISDPATNFDFLTNRQLSLTITG